MSAYSFNLFFNLNKGATVFSNCIIELRHVRFFDKQKADSNFIHARAVISGNKS
jgi:hypothetical protein